MIAYEITSLPEQNMSCLDRDLSTDMTFDAQTLFYASLAVTVDVRKLFLIAYSNKSVKIQNTTRENCRSHLQTHTHTLIFCSTGPFSGVTPG